MQVFRLILALCLLPHSAFAAGSKVKGSWVVNCRRNGFDPEQLACSTCNVLPSRKMSECLQCCQAWLDTKRIRKPYESAVLVDRGGGDELTSFLRDDWEEVVSATKEGSKRLQHIKMGSEVSYSLFHARPSQLLFFNEKVTSTDLTALSKKAVEIVDLSGMKRDDMKDMLMTLLP